MRIFADTASLAEIEEWAAHPWVSGFTTNPTLMNGNLWVADGSEKVSVSGLMWAQHAVEAVAGKPISIDGPPEVWDLGHNVVRKVVDVHSPGEVTACMYNYTAVCTVEQASAWKWPAGIISVFAGRIMDTGRDPQPVIDAAKATGAQVLWASAREPYHVVMAEQAGCDIITLTPAILRKWIEFQGMPLEVLAELTIAQFDHDREGLW